MLRISISTLPLLFATFIICTLTSCLYRMPKEDDLHTIPLTNNPNVTNDPGSLTVPGADY